MHTNRHFPVRCLLVHYACAVGELEEGVVCTVALQERIVLVGQRAPHSLYGDIFAPLQFLDERYAVEQFAVHVPCHRSEGIAVCEELHVFHHRERALPFEERDVDGRHDKQRERYLVPLYATVQVGIDVAPRAKPEALVYLSLRIVELVFASEEVLEAHCVAQRKLRCVKIDGPAVLLGVDERLSWAVTEH